jgi:hypothetical protein
MIGVGVRCSKRGNHVDPAVLRQKRHEPRRTTEAALKVLMADAGLSALMDRARFWQQSTRRGARPVELTFDPRAPSRP